MSQNNQFTVATYNIQFGINRGKIIENIVQMAKDGVGIFCLQEIINVAGEEFIINSILNKLGQDWDARYHVGTEMSKLSIGTAILWNKKILTFKQEEKILLPKIDSFALHEKFYYYVIGVAAMPLQRKALTCYFSAGKTNIRVTCIHVDNVGGPVHRLLQIEYLIDKLRSLETAKHEIICGDFNTFDLLQTGYEKDLLQKKLGDDFIDASRDIEWTSDIHSIDFSKSLESFQWLIKTFKVHIRKRLDYIWVRNFKVEECQKIEITGSDHFPVVAGLKLS